MIDKLNHKCSQLKVIFIIVLHARPYHAAATTGTGQKPDALTYGYSAAGQHAADALTHSHSAAGQHISEAPTWLRVGWTQPVSIAFRVAMASIPPAAPRQCPIMDLVPFTFKCFVSGRLT